MNFPDSPKPESPTQTSTSRSIFRKLQLDVQRDYARSHWLPGVDTLTTDEICDALFKESDWTPALEIEGHVRLVTAGGVVVAREVMDLVDWLVEHHPDSILSDTHPDNVTEIEPARTLPLRSSPINLGGTGQRHSYETLEEMAMELQRAHALIKAVVEESRKAAREAYADIFMLQSQLAEENVIHSELVDAITNIVGSEEMQRIQGQLRLEKRDDYWNETQMDRKSKSKPTSYHVLTVAWPTDGVHASTDDSVTTPFIIARTILDYCSADEGTDDTYSDSNGTEQDFVDDPYKFRDARGRSPAGEIPDEPWEHLSIDKLSDVEKGIPWKTFPDLLDNSSDPDYEPPPWDFEDVWEIENELNESRIETHPLFQFNFANALRDCGGAVSDAGLSTDDTDTGYHDLGIIQRPAASPPFFVDEFSSSLGPHLITHWYDQLRAEHDPNMDDETFERIKQSAIRRSKFTEWEMIRGRLLEGSSSPVDLDHRLDGLLESNHAQFYFDDQEWKTLNFERPA